MRCVFPLVSLGFFSLGVLLLLLSFLGKFPFLEASRFLFGNGGLIPRDSRGKDSEVAFKELSESLLSSFFTN